MLLKCLEKRVDNLPGLPSQPIHIPICICWSNSASEKKLKTQNNSRLNKSHICEFWKSYTKNISSITLLVISQTLGNFFVYMQTCRRLPCVKHNALGLEYPRLKRVDSKTNELTQNANIIFKKNSHHQQYVGV